MASMASMVSLVPQAPREMQVDWVARATVEARVQQVLMAPRARCVAHLVFLVPRAIQG